MFYRLKSEYAGGKSAIGQTYGLLFCLTSSKNNYSVRMRECVCVCMHAYVCVCVCVCVFYTVKGAGCLLVQL